jgi:hypothetical protein
MDTGRRQGKAEVSQIEFSLCKIADADDEMIDTAGHGISVCFEPVVTCGLSAGQSIVTGARLKKIYCKATAYQ